MMDSVMVVVKTEVLNIIKDVKLNSAEHQIDFQTEVSDIFSTFTLNENPVKKEIKCVNLTINDFGGDHEYFYASKIFFNNNGIYMIMFNILITALDFTSNIGNYIELILQNDKNPVICLVASKCDLAEETEVCTKKLETIKQTVLFKKFGQCSFLTTDA